MTSSLLIAIDGPAASGKGTLARRLADYYHSPGSASAWPRTRTAPR